MGMTLKEVGRTIPHYNKPIIKPIMKVGIIPELVEQKIWTDKDGITWIKPVFPEGQKEFRVAHTNLYKFLDVFVSKSASESSWNAENFNYKTRGGILDVDPPDNRPSCQAQLEGTATTPTKSQGIMECIFDGMDIGEIRIREYLDDEILKHEITFTYTAQDGSNRVRTMIFFPNGEFRMRESYRSTIEKFQKYDFYNFGTFNNLSNSWPEDVKNYLKNYIVTIKVYENMTEAEAKIQFDNINKNTKQSAQQNRNGHGRKNLAIIIRHFVRGHDFGDSSHPLFVYKVNKKTKKHIFTYFTGTNDLLQLEEMVSQICYRYYQKLIIKGGIFLGTASQVQQDKMYQAFFSDTEIKKLKTAITNHLDFMLEMAKKENFQFANRDFHLYSRLYFSMLDYNSGKTPKIKDENKFHDDINRARGRIENNKERQEGDDKERTVSSAFKGYLGNHEDFFKIKTSMEVLLSELNLEHHIKNLDPNRCKPRKELEYDWLNLDKKCFVLGIEIPFPECQGGHLVSHNNGGRLGKNIKPMYRPINNFMSDQNYDDFMKEHMPNGKFITKKLYDYMERHASEKIIKVLKKVGIMDKSILL